MKTNILTNLVVLGRASVVALCALLMLSSPTQAKLRAADLHPERASQYEKIEPKPCDQVSTDDHILTSTREMLEETFCGLALWLDGVGGDKGDVLAARRTRGYARFSYYHSQFGGAEFRARLRVRVELPLLKQRLSAFIGIDNEDEFIQGRSEGFALRSEFPSLGDDDKWLAGLGYRFPGSETFRSDFRIGARRLVDTEVFLQNRFRYLAYADNINVLSLRETLFWTNEEGFGATTGIDWMHVIRKDLLARWDTVGTVSEERRGLDWRSAAVLYKQLGDDRGMAYQLFIRGETGHPVPIREYGFRSVYRFPIFTNRLITELAAGYSWPRSDPLSPREGSVGAGFSFEFPFGDQPN